MLVYGCATAVAAAAWLVWGFLNSGFAIQHKDGWLAAIVFAIYIAPVVGLKVSRRSEWEPLFQPTPGKITAARAGLILAFANFLVWPLFVPQLFALLLPSFALLSATVNALDSAFLMANIFPGIARFRTGQVSAISQITRPVFRLFERAPELGFEEWSDGISKLARLISHESSLRQAWIEKNRSVTTIEDYVELHSEIFVQLESERCLKAYAGRLSSSRLRAIRRFLDAIHKFDKYFNAKPSLRDSKILLSSTEWGHVRNAASKLNETKS
jgi:hypothetical protein